MPPARMLKVPAEQAQGVIDALRESAHQQLAKAQQLKAAAEATLADCRAMEQSLAPKSAKGKKGKKKAKAAKAGPKKPRAKKAAKDEIEEHGQPSAPAAPTADLAESA